MNTQAIRDTAAGTAPAWHTLSVGEAAARLRVSTEGLTAGEALRRLAEYGPNELQAADQLHRPVVPALGGLIGELRAGHGKGHQQCEAENSFHRRQLTFVHAIGPNSCFRVIQADKVHNF